MEATETVDEVKKRWHDGSSLRVLCLIYRGETYDDNDILMGIGAALMYFFDPDSGRPRHEHLCNRILHAPLTKGEFAMSKYLLAWLLGVPAIVLVIIYLYSTSESPLR
jgi:hypothetical protein